MRRTTHIKKIVGSTHRPYRHQHCGHFFSLPSRSQPKPLCPLTDNTHASTIVTVGAPNSATVSNGSHRRSKTTVVDPPPNGLHAAHVPTAFPDAAAVTEIPDDVNRSMTDLLRRNHRRWPIRGCGHHRLQLHRRHQRVVHIIVKLIVIIIVFLVLMM